MHLEIITPDKKLFSGDVISVLVPGAAGQFQVLNNHAPIISTLIKGKVKIKTKEGEKSFDVNSGVIEVLKNNVVVLVE
ncbi:MAG TPA: ATP synthase F1 subunit epsilon [Bacteroidia bacterium]|jgi:F-type H+-transporting ATPase subunit epsilon|nr:ATP synthase F1 subunit epsilon [Bacteroidia bacterium]